MGAAVKVVAVAVKVVGAGVTLAAVAARAVGEDPVKVDVVHARAGEDPVKVDAAHARADVVHVAAGRRAIRRPLRSRSVGADLKVGPYTAIV